MVKEIGGRWWYCCPRCGKKLHPLRAGAVCRGVLARCRERRCGWSGEIVVDPGDWRRVKPILPV